MAPCFVPPTAGKLALATPTRGSSIANVSTRHPQRTAPICIRRFSRIVAAQSDYPTESSAVEENAESYGNQRGTSMPIRDLPPEKVDYLNNTENSAVHYQRLLEISKEQQASSSSYSSGAGARGSTSTGSPAASSSYLDMLNQQNTTTRSWSTPDESSRRAGLSANEAYLDDLAKGKITFTQTPVTPSYSSYSPGASAPSGTSRAALDDQIAFLEGHLQKLLAQEQSRYGGSQGASSSKKAVVELVNEQTRAISAIRDAIADHERRLADVMRNNQ